MAQTKNVVLVATITATGEIVKDRFVNFSGAQAKAGEAVLGVAPYDVANGDTAAVDVVGIAVVEAGGEIAAGAQVGADAQGCAVTGAAKIAGTALTAAAGAGEIIRVLLKG
ncbi:capsid cement protein [Neisseria musculi]|uniref:DUF2190 family protein n=1 Tax=Neisseria musculi TaxID=1815583 RepID=A0A7H1MFC9_9NEIS|nr:capsid cement protein [Neisseria musculi]QNT60344.1 hypothetical protein H7A79_0998 [Neisseria musculi]